ncbi:hypothetical protein SeLEV6574_g07467 [Synchytrium endobioticum]|uniref:Uncharacterized protein n=1 Tax=Synchytrium endobioticum TaxID=286115 RepID=A0A507CHK1_9FUNG|nr:hypothetical protein SeLEV6574_g07467 [Synchytrium endobioticum]
MFFVDKTLTGLSRMTLNSQHEDLRDKKSLGLTVREPVEDQQEMTDSVRGMRTASGNTSPNRAAISHTTANTGVRHVTVI